MDTIYLVVHLRDSIKGQRYDMTSMLGDFSWAILLQLLGNFYNLWVIWLLSLGDFLSHWFWVTLLFDVLAADVTTLVPVRTGCIVDLGNNFGWFVSHLYTWWRRTLLCRGTMKWVSINWFAMSQQICDGFVDSSASVSYNISRLTPLDTNWLRFAVRLWILLFLQFTIQTGWCHLVQCRFEYWANFVLDIADCYFRGQSLRKWFCKFK